MLQVPPFPIVKPVEFALHWDGNKAISFLRPVQCSNVYCVNGRNNCFLHLQRQSCFIAHLTIWFNRFGTRWCILQMLELEHEGQFSKGNGCTFEAGSIIENIYYLFSYEMIPSSISTLKRHNINIQNLNARRGLSTSRILALSFHCNNLG